VKSLRKNNKFHYIVNSFTNRALMNNSAMTIYDIKYASWPV